MSGSVVLRPWEATDAPAIAPMRDDPHLRRWSSLPELGPERWIAEQRAGARGPSLAICAAEDSARAALGKIALRLPGHASPATTCAAMRASDQPAGELSYWMVPVARGRGLAATAVALMLDRARQIPDLRSVVLDIEPGNAPSVRLAHRLGAEQREPVRTEIDRLGVPRRLAVFVVGLPSR